jgi:hypothetical protein
MSGEVSAPKRRSIPDNQRFGVWKAWAGKCFWCREPVKYPNCEIDHVIPLDAIRGGKADAVRTQFGLLSAFDFDSFENWVPAHSGCNRRKSSIVLDPSPAFSLHLAEVKAKMPLVVATANAIAQDVRKGPLLARLKMAIDAGDITEAEIRELWAGLPVPVTKAGTLQHLQKERLQIAPGWEVAQVNGALQYVQSKGGRFGVTSSSDHHSWVCSQCGNKGPWNGIICLSCGNREEPD